MSLPTGARFGPHEILGPIGAGGMGEVYRARDTTLDRDVALKVLAPEFSTDADRLARFEREAKTLASLNHAHIAQIYGLERGADGVRAIVMELVEGEDLAQRLRRGALPIDEALYAARQVADALDVAHAAGVIHRDLKPGNVKIRPDGVVKVLDFGLAKLARDQGPEGAEASASTTMSPAMTGVGVILGTAAYMAPEQAKGRAVDKRADVWAFGCLLFEMLTGQRLFAADSVSETIAAVLTREPRWTQLPEETPESIRRLLRRCLVRDPRQRLSDIGVARLEIDDALSGEHAPPAPRRLKRLWPVAIATGVLGIAIGWAVFNWLRAEPPETPVRMLTIATDPKITSAQLSPDGRSLAFIRDERLVVRFFETGDEHEVPEDRVSNPFWSWDSTHVAYFKRSDLGTELRFVPAKGGTSQLLIPSAQGMKDRPSPYALLGGTWCKAGIVVVDSNAQHTMQMFSETGQEMGSFSTSDRGNLAFPHCLPDGRILAIQTTIDTAAVVVVSKTEQVVLLKEDITNRVDVRWPVLVGSNVVFEKTDPTQGLWTFPVNTGFTPQTVTSRLVLKDATRPSAAAGMLTALTGVHAVDRNLVLVDRAGNQIESFGKPQREFRTPSLSPDGTMVITGGRRQNVDGLWMHKKDAVLPWHDEGASGWTAWSPDSKRIAFVTNRDPKAGTKPELVVRSVAGDERYVIAAGALGPNWIDNEELVFFRPGQPGQFPTVWRVTAKEGATAGPIPIGNAREASFSLDRKLIAWASDTAGRLEVFVAPVEHLEQFTQISKEGGRYPRWTSTGLFYACGDPVEATPGANRAMCVARVNLTSGIKLGEPTQLFDAAAHGFRLIIYGERGYDVNTKGDRILVQTAGREGMPSITLIENVQSWLKRVR